MPKVALDSYLAQARSRKRRTRVFLVVALVTLVIAVVAFFGTYAYLQGRSGSRSGLPPSAAVRKAVRALGGKPAHHMTYTQFKESVGSVSLCAKYKPEEEFEVTSEGGRTTRFYLVYTDGLLQISEAARYFDQLVEKSRQDEFLYPGEQVCYPLPSSGICSLKSRFLEVVGKPDRMKTAGRSLQFEYDIRGGRVRLSVLRLYWELGVVWIRSMSYQGAYSD